MEHFSNNPNVFTFSTHGKKIFKRNSDLDIALMMAQPMMNFKTIAKLFRN
jgi:hypothetical protein